MNKYVKTFLHRGLMFSGFGPIVGGIVYFILDLTGTQISINGSEILLAVVTTYLIAFIHAGSSVFPQIENWPLFKSIFFQGLSIYLAYTIGYLINSWIPLDLMVILIYSGCFIGAFLITWLIIYIISNKVTKKMNNKLNEINK